MTSNVGINIYENVAFERNDIFEESGSRIYVTDDQRGHGGYINDDHAEDGEDEYVIHESSYDGYPNNTVNFYEEPSDEGQIESNVNHSNNSYSKDNPSTLEMSTKNRVIVQPAVDSLYENENHSGSFESNQQQVRNTDTKTKRFSGTPCSKLSSFSKMTLSIVVMMILAAIIILVGMKALPSDTVKGTTIVKCLFVFLIFLNHLIYTFS